MAKAVRWDLIADPRGFNRGFRDANRTADHFARGMKRTSSLVSGALASIAAVGVVSVLKGTIDKASDLNETVSKTNVIFGKSAKEIRDWSQGSARSMGLSRQEALASAASFGDMFLQLKLGRKPAVDMSTQMVELAADFASFHNADITQVLEAQSAAFRGEYDSIQRFIPGITAARVEQVALNQTHKDSAKDLTAADKALATYSIMQKDAAKAVGDHGRTSDQAAGQMRIFAANIKDIQASIGQALLPAFNGAVTFINESFIPAVEKWWKVHGPQVQDMFGKVADKAEEFWVLLRDELWPELLRGADYLEQNVLPKLRELRQAWDDNSEAISDFKVELKPVTDNVFPVLSYLIRGTVDEIKEAIAIVGFLARAWTVATKIVNVAVTKMVITWVEANRAIIRGAATLAEALHLPIAKGLRKAEQSMGSWVKDFNANLNKLDDEGVTIKLKSTFTPPKGFSMHSIVGAQKGMRIPGYGGGDRVPIMAEAGEAVVPKHLAATSGFKGWAGAHGIPGFATGGVIPDLRTFSPAGMQGTQAGIDQRVADLAAAGIRRSRRLLLGGGPGIQRALNWARGQEGRPYLWGGVGPAGYDCSGFMSAIANVVMGRAPHRRLFATGSFPVGGWASGYSPLGFSIGSRRGNPGHMAGTLGGVNVESRGSAGVVVGSGARGARDSLFGGNVWHMAGRSGAKSNSKETFTFFDKGGYLPPGLSMAYNGTGRPERVLPPGGSGIDYDRLAKAIVTALAERPPRAYLDPNQARQGIRNAQRRAGVPATQQVR